MTDSVEDRWRELLFRAEAQSREVDAESPLRMLIGLSQIGRPYFAIIVERKPGIPTVASSIEITRRQRADGRWTLVLELQERALTDAFISLVSDLASRSAAAPSEQAAIEGFLETLGEWRELLTAQAEHLSEGALRGLIAELWFGFVSRAHGHTLPEAARSWTGPMGGTQDFQFPTPGHCFEVKSLRPARTTVEITSEDQLDGDRIRLAVVTLEEATESSGAITLPRLITSVRSSFVDGADRAEFNRRFAMLRIDPDDLWYAGRSYAIRRLQVFDTKESFPALRRSQLPQAISRASYRIDIQHLQQFLESDIAYSDRSETSNG